MKNEPTPPYFGNTTGRIVRTFLVQYPVGNPFHAHPDEVDGRGDTSGEALTDAEKQAAWLYEPGYTLVEINAGGSAGLVRW